MFGQPLQGLLGALAVVHAFGTPEWGGNTIAEADPTEDIKVEPVGPLFSSQWAQKFSEDNPGCDLGRGLYTWRPAGFGSNINNLLNSWVYGLVVEDGWSDVAVLVDSTQLQQLDCFEESGGLASHGWGCLFTSMPHLCTFQTTKTWKQHLKMAGVSRRDQKEAQRISRNLQVIRGAEISQKFEVLDVDQRGAKAVMAKFLWSNMAPWLRKDIDVVTHVRETFGTSPFVGIHIRRGDKIVGRDARFEHSVEKYLATAVRFLDQEPNSTSVDAIKGIWVATDDATVMGEVRTLANAYFPSVHSEDIVFAAGGVPGGVQTSKITTHSVNQGYGVFVYLIADLEQLAAADLFVGTCSSNLGRLVMVLRDGLGKDRESAISLDIPWAPNRRRSLVQD